MTKDILRQLPSVDSLLKTEALERLIEKYGREIVVDAVRKVIEELRSAIRKEEKDSPAEDKLSQESILKEIETHLQKAFLPSLVKAVNASGVILHTGLGRAVLSEDAQDAINEVIEGYCTLATDVETGRRGHRDVHLDDLLCEITGAEAATVVNNNAAATMLTLNTLANGKEVIVSRGQLVEIGGAFRMPDVMAASGAILREVGTTNRTHLWDYASVIWEETGAIMRVHHSNYRIVGFSGEPDIEELAQLAKEHNVPLIDDLGSGALVDVRDYGFESEPMVQHSLMAGADVACFSGDKLIGGPQAGIIVGKADLIKRIRKNPLARAFRIGKMTIAGMEATLRLFRLPEKLKEKHPVHKMFALPIEKIESRAKKVMRSLMKQIPEGVEFSVVEGGSQVGSGSVPVQTIPTKLLMVKSKDLSADSLGRLLRYNQTPVFPRVQNDAVLLDVRTIQEEEDKVVLDALLFALKRG
ncbi:MAG: L-seryl-tRNA(Sec) selenium transferase [Candidatus Aminicenantes bacterium]|nr:MAG: L-seryl-tRNA(Sec) selenium transferase [Candidatus Aminicenantes bacterium]